MKRTFKKLLTLSAAILAFSSVSLQASSSSSDHEALEVEQKNAEKRRRLTLAEEMIQFYLDFLVKTTTKELLHAHDVYVQGVSEGNPSQAGFNLSHSLKLPNGFPLNDAFYILKELEAQGKTPKYYSDSGCVDIQNTDIHESFSGDVAEFSQMQTLMWRILGKKNIHRFYPESLYSYDKATIAFSENMHLYRFLAHIFDETKDTMKSYFSHKENIALWIASELEQIDKSLNFGDETVFQSEGNIESFLISFYGDAGSTLGNAAWNTYTGSNYDPSLPKMLDIISTLKNPEDIDTTNDSHIFALSLLKLHKESVLAHRVLLERRVTGTAIEAASTLLEIIEQEDQVEFLGITKNSIKLPLYDTVPVFSALNAHAQVGEEISREFFCKMILKYGEDALMAIVTSDHTQIREEDRASFEKQLILLSKLGVLPSFIFFEDAPHDIDDQIGIGFCMALAARGQISQLDIVHSCKNTNTHGIITNFPLIYQLLYPTLTLTPTIKFYFMPRSTEPFVAQDGSTIPFPIRAIHRRMNEEFQTHGMMREAEIFKLNEGVFADKTVIFQAPVTFSGSIKQ